MFPTATPTAAVIVTTIAVVAPPAVAVTDAAAAAAANVTATLPEYVDNRKEIHDRSSLTLPRVQYSLHPFVSPISRHRP
jgi:hypothetical protein